MQENLKSLFKAVRILLQATSWFMLFLNIFYALYVFKWKKQGRTLEGCVGKFFSKKKGIFLCETLLLLGILSSPFVFCHFENTNIGSFLEKESYEEQYYVFIRNNSTQLKAYRCKADIYKGDYGHFSYTDEREEVFTVQGNGYFLKKVYWNNGGYLTFIDDDWIETASPTRVYPGKEALVTDCHDNEYYVTLTTEKVK